MLASRHRRFRWKVQASVAQRSIHDGAAAFSHHVSTVSIMDSTDTLRHDKHGVLYKDSTVAPPNGLLQDPCPLGLPETLPDSLGPMGLQVYR